MVLGFTLNWDNTIVYLLPLILFILIGGIPHGAVDHKLAESINNKGSNKIDNFWSKYFAGIFMIAAFWIISDVGALILFIVCSALHFGQGHFHFSTIKKKLGGPLAFALELIWGLWLFSTLFVFNSGETQEVVNLILLSGIKMNIHAIFSFVLLISLVLLSALFIYFKAKELIDNKELGEQLVQMFVITCIFYATPLLASFCIYFVFWHSIQSFYMHLDIFEHNGAKINLKRYLAIGLPFSLLAIFFILMVSTSIEQDIIESNLGWFFMGISIISMPHMIITDEILKIDRVKSG